MGQIIPSGSMTKITLPRIFKIRIGEEGVERGGALEIFRGPKPIKHSQHSNQQHNLSILTTWHLHRHHLFTPHKKLHNSIHHRHLLLPPRHINTQTNLSTRCNLMHPTKGPATTDNRIKITMHNHINHKTSGLHIKYLITNLNNLTLVTTAEDNIREGNAPRTAKFATIASNSTILLIFVDQHLQIGLVADANQNLLDLGF